MDSTIYGHKLEKHGRGCVNWSWIRRGWDGLWRSDLDDVVVEEHHLEEEGDDYVEEDDWDDEYPAHARVRLIIWSIKYFPRQVELGRRYRLQDGVHVCTNKVPRYGEAHPSECPPQHRERGNTDQLNSRVRSRKSRIQHIEWAARTEIGIHTN